MNCIQKLFSTQTEVKKSKFLSFLVPIDEFKSLRAKLKQEHPKANHIVWAYRELNQFKQIEENSSDDGEPKGGAGVPTLNQLRGAELVNCAILTVRYFGGIKLGVGGMARAYSAAAKAVIDIAQIVPYIEMLDYTIKAPYSEQRQIEYHLKQLKIEQIEREFAQNEVLWHIKASKEQIARVKELI